MKHTICALSIMLFGYHAAVQAAPVYTPPTTTVVYGGYRYTITSQNLTYNANSATLAAQPWWGNSTLGNALAGLVKGGAGGYQGAYSGVAALFGYALNGSYVSIDYWASSTLHCPTSCPRIGDNYYYAYLISMQPDLTLTGSALDQHNNPGVNAARILDANSVLQSRFSGLSTAQQQSVAVSQTLPVLTGAATQATQAASTAINQVIVGRLSSQRGQSSGDTFYTDKNVWVKPFGSRANQADTDGVSGYKADIYGLAGGVDGKVNNKLRLGAAFSYARSNVDGNSSSAQQSLNVDSYQLIGYGSYDLNERTALDFQADLGQNKNESSRGLSFINSVAKANYDSWTAHTGLSLSRRYDLSEKNSLIPSLRVDYTRIRADGYQENGADTLDLHVGSQNTEALVFGVDGKLISKLNDKLTLSSSIGVGYDAMSKQNAVTSVFAGAPGAAFTTSGINPSPWLGRGALGLSYKTKNGMEITGRYDLEYRQSYLGQTVSLNLNMPF